MSNRNAISDLVVHITKVWFLPVFSSLCFIFNIFLQHGIKTHNGHWKSSVKGRFNFINSQIVYNFICTICKNVLRNAVQIPESNDSKRSCLEYYKDNIRYVSGIGNDFFVFFYYRIAFAGYLHSSYRISFSMW